MSSASDCQSKFQSALNLYWGVVGTSLALTVLNLVVSRICLRARIQNSPMLGAKLYISTGSVKLLLGILILSVFHPSCPDGCMCYGTLPSYFYGILVLVIGVLWIMRGVKYLQIARSAQGEEGPEAKEVETAVPTGADMI